MLPPTSFAIAEALAACGEEAIKELRYDTSHTAEQRAACVRALGTMEAKAAKDELVAFEGDDSGYVLAELARYLNPLRFSVIRKEVVESGSIPHWFPREYIRDLEPLQDIAANVTRLNCYKTQVSDLSPLSKLKNLTELYCWITPVSDLSPLSNLTKLSAIDCSGTQVSDLSPLVELPKLTRIYCNKALLDSAVPAFRKAREAAGLPEVNIHLI
jgi:hypothetical protein